MEQRGEGGLGMIQGCCPCRIHWILEGQQPGQNDSSGEIMWIQWIQLSRSLCHLPAAWAL